MNAYYENNSNCSSNNDVFEAYFYGDARVGKIKKAADVCLAALSALILLLSGLRIRGAVRAAALSLCLIAFIGVIGAMESGVLGIGMGLLIGGLILGAEFLCLRRQ